TAGDYSPYCITAPNDARLAGGGGYQVCGLYDVSPAKFGQVNTLVTQGSNFGSWTQIYNGFDLGIRARFGRGFLAGGVNTGQTVTNECETGPNAGATNYVLGFPAGSRYCQVTLPF